MKKIFIFVLVAIFATFSAVVMTACADDDISQSPFAVTVTIDNSTIHVKVFKEDLSSTPHTQFSLTKNSDFMLGIIEQINSSENQSKPVFDLTFSDFGAFINCVKYDSVSYGDSAANKYVMMYLDSSNIAYVDFSYDSFIFNGITYNPALLGLSQMPVLDTVTYVFTVVAF